MNSSENKVVIRVQFYKFSNELKQFVPPKRGEKIYRFLCDKDIFSKLDDDLAYVISTKDSSTYNSPVRVITAIVENADAVFNSKSLKEIVHFYSLKEHYATHFLTTKEMETVNRKLLNSPEETNDVVNKTTFKTSKFNFGKVPAGKLKYSMLGLAFENETGDYTIYNAETDEWLRVNDFLLDMDDFLYKIPVALKDVKRNDVVARNGTYYVVVDTYENALAVINPCSNIKSIMMPSRNGICEYVLKVVNIAEKFIPKSKPNKDNPFDNYEEMLMFSILMKGGKESDILMRLITFGDMKEWFENEK